MSLHAILASLRRLRAQVVKELLCVLRDPKSRVVLIVPPLVQLFIFSFAATLEVKNIDIALLNRDSGAASVELVQQLAASDLVRRIHPVSHEAAVADMIDRQQVIAAVLIDDSFSRHAAAGKEGVAQIIIDGRRANAGQISLAYLQAIAARAGATLRGEAPADTLQVRHEFNPNLNYRWFVVPGLIGILISFVSLLLTALSIARERELGAFEQLLVSPCTPVEIIVAKMIPAFLVGLVLTGFMSAAAILLLGIPFCGSPWLLIACLLLFILSLVGLGLMISSVCATQQQAILGTFTLVVPSVLLSGFAAPVQNMPIFLQWVAEAIPLKHFLIILHGCFLKDMPAREIFANAWPMALIAVLTLGLSIHFVRARLY